jgi:hypothetical protein
MKKIESKNQWLTWILFGILFIWSAVLTYAFLTKTPFDAKNTADQILKVRGLVVVDQNGIERVWIGAPLPEPIILGKRIPRGGDVSGILLFDSEGNERSGYVTADGYPNVFFTLDGLGSQQVLFLTEPQGTPALMLWHGSSRFQLVVDKDQPELSLRKGNEILLEIPPIKNKEQ